MREELKKNWLFLLMAFLVGLVVFLLGERNNSRLYQSVIVQNQQLLILKSRTEQALKNSPAQTQQFFKNLGYNVVVNIPKEEPK